MNAELLTAAEFVKRLEALQSDDERDNYGRYFKMGKGEYGEGDVFMGVRMGQVFDLAKEFIEMSIAEIEKLLEGEIHEIRAGGCSIMDKQARAKKTPVSHKKELYDLYLRRHDRVNNWDLVDLAAPFVVGGYLADKPRDVLYELARSANMWERRTAITATFYFIRKGEADDTFRIAEMLLDDEEDLVHKAVGGGVRWAGAKNLNRLLEFLEKHATRMPRTMLRYSIEHLSKDQKDYYLGLKKAANQ